MCLTNRPATIKNCIRKAAIISLFTWAWGSADAQISLTGHIEAQSLEVTGTVEAATLSGALSTTARNSITSVGTITIGNWNGSVISGQYGGTGVNNSSRTITIGGNLTTSGAFNITLNATALTNITLPTTGTLATLDGAEILTNKTINGSNNTVSNIATSSLTGVLQAAQFPALTGDVTTSASSLATTIGNNAVSSAKFRQSAANTLVGNATGSAANVTDVAMGTTMTMTGGSLNALGALINVRVLTSGTSYVPTTGTTRITMYVIGPGGGGGGGGTSNDMGSGGGGAGGTCFVPYLVLPGAASYTYAIGTGGTGNGSNGSGSTTITINGVTYTGGAGSGGSNSTTANNNWAAGGAGGTASGTGATFINGQAGFYGGNGPSAAMLTGGAGGSSLWGRGGRTIIASSAATGNVAGTSGTGFGAGGGGATGNAAGGDGTGGIIVIYEYR